MKLQYGVGVASDGVTFMPNLVKVGHLVQHLKWMHPHSHTIWLDYKLTFSVEEEVSKLKIVK
jgi:hypothetical protein